MPLPGAGCLALAVSACSPAPRTAAPRLQRRLHRRRRQQELVTAGEIDQRIAACTRRRRSAPARSRRRAEQLRRQVLDALIEERVLITYARDSGAKVDEAEIDRAVQSIAAQNQIERGRSCASGCAPTASTTRAFAPTCATRS